MKDKKEVEKKEIKKKEVEAEVLKLQDLISRLPKGVSATETTRGTILRSGKIYLMHVAQTPRGIHHYIRTPTGRHLESSWASTESEINLLIKEIDGKIKDQKIDDKIKSKK